MWRDYSEAETERDMGFAEQAGPDQGDGSVR